MKYFLLIVSLFIVDYSDATEQPGEYENDVKRGWTLLYCGESEFLECVDLQQSACTALFAQSISECDAEWSASAAIVDKEKSPVESTNKSEKAKRDIGKCLEENLYPYIKKELLDSCVESHMQRMIEKIEKKYNKAQKKGAINKSGTS